MVRAFCHGMMGLLSKVARRKVFRLAVLFEADM